MSEARRQSRPSDKVNPKTIDPFKDTRTKSIFATAYGNGGIPCRLIHGSVKHKLSWNQPLDTIPFDPVLILLAEGLRETVHPYPFVARVGFQELLEIPGAGDRAVIVIQKLIPSLRAALGHKNDEVFTAGLEATVQLSKVVGSALNAHLKVLLSSVSRQMMNKKHHENISNALHAFEQNGGKECEVIIKSKIPTYSSPFH